MLLLPALFAACNKEDLSGDKAMQVVINGYNGGIDELEVSIDTTIYDKNTSNGKFTLKPASVIGFNVTYTYPFAQTQHTLRIKNPATGKVLFSKPLPEEGTKAVFNFIYINGKEVDVNAPAAGANTNKLGFYLHGTESNDPIDIFLYRLDETNGAEHREYLAKNVVPNIWTYIDYMPTAAFDDKNELDKSSMCFTKAGTIDQWAFQHDEDRSKLPPVGMNLPFKDERGLVQPYFITSGTWALEYSRLYFHPDRVR